MKRDTRILRAGCEPEANSGILNPPVYHASTIAASSLEDSKYRADNRYEEGVFAYGLDGTPTQTTFEKAVACLEGAERSIALPTGLASVTVSLLSFLKPGDHLLMVDTAYGPTRVFCEKFLRPIGIDVTFCDPLIGKGISDLLRPTTRVVYAESPGSATFEIQDIPAIVEATRSHDAVVMVDNTWAAGYYFRPLEIGADLSLQAATKYIGGHSDLMLGTIALRFDLYTQVKSTARMFGYHAAPDDCYLALRGMRSMPTRLAHHQKSARDIAHWLNDRPEVSIVLYPALPSCPGHEIWQRDFTGSTGLFSIILERGYSDSAVASMVDGLELFNIGSSWGGAESLVSRQHPEGSHSAVPWAQTGAILRFHIGLEDVDDLKTDIEAGFHRLNASYVPATAKPHLRQPATRPGIRNLQDAAT